MKKTNLKQVIFIGKHKFFNYGHTGTILISDIDVPENSDVGFVPDGFVKFFQVKRKDIYISE